MKIVEYVSFRKSDLTPFKRPDVNGKEKRHREREREREKGRKGLGERTNPCKICQEKRENTSRLMKTEIVKGQTKKKKKKQKTTWTVVGKQIFRNYFDYREHGRA
ncbi:hypothetical protein RUM43_009232 [Polyplax serrata]|uniref:Uncharacterized protein n=1 Tax=Polyplax serrata TaxID=468196 RepID=A0AAN8NP61_POLSC